MSPLYIILLGCIYSASAGTFDSFFKKKEPSVVRTPEKQFAELAYVGYPWTPNYLTLSIPHYPKLRMHYLDEGPKNTYETLLLLHGTPAWSFLYRTMIPVFLKAGYRVIAPDFIGFGRSDKLTSVDSYSHELHVMSLLTLLEALKLERITLVGQDLGGLTGLSAVARAPESFSRLILLNTWLPQGDMLSSAYKISQHIPYLSWRTLTTVLKRHVPVKTVFELTSKASKKAVKKGYGAPYPNSLYKAGPAFWPLMIPLYPNEPVAIEMQTVAMFLKNQWRKPALVGYSEKEVFTLSGLEVFKDVLPNACFIPPVPDAGHFLQEDQGPGLANMVVNFINVGCI